MDPFSTPIALSALAALFVVLLGLLILALLGLAVSRSMRALLVEIRDDQRAVLTELRRQAGETRSEPGRLRGKELRAERI